MSFQALARTWRPRRFDQLVGQEHVVRALTHALDGDKLHHALLFSGTRGVGKTTLARIIAKCLNCEHGVSASPCVGAEACSTCREIDEGRYVDLIEVDAASRTGVDDTRELMDNVQYAPTRGRTKVYLIDEVHMLTKHSFNALLKTLEEPPPRVQFLLATTEPEKIPVTILSRCLQFPLKRLSAARITDRLRDIVKAEGLSADDDALVELARGADGSVRDGLSLLDQAVAFGGGHLEVDNVRDMLGTIGEARVAELVNAVIDARATDALIALESLYEQGLDMRYLLDALATAWQHVATVQVVGEAVDDDSARWQDCAQRLDPRETQLFYDITLTGIRDLFNAPDPLVGVKMCVLRMLAFKPDSGEGDDINPAPPPAADTDSSKPVAPSSSAATLSARDAMAQARAQLQGGRSGAGNFKPAPDHENRATSEQDNRRENTDYAAAQVAQKPALSAGPAAPVALEPDSRADDNVVDAHDDAPMSASSVEVALRGNMPEESVRSEDLALSKSPDTTGHSADDEAHAGADIRAHDALIDSMADAAGGHEAGNRSGHSTPPTDASSDTAQSADDGARLAAANGFDFATSTDHPEDWHALVPTLDVTGFAAQLANHGVCRHLDNTRIELEIARSNALLATDDARERLQAALATAWGSAEAPRLKISVVDELHDTPAKRSEADADKRQQDAVASIENDPIIRKLRSQLGARLRPETIKPHRSPGAMHQRDEQ